MVCLHSRSPTRPQTQSTLQALRLGSSFGSSFLSFVRSLACRPPCWSVHWLVRQRLLLMVADGQLPSDRSPSDSRGWSSSESISANRITKTKDAPEDRVKLRAKPRVVKPLALLSAASAMAAAAAAASFLAKRPPGIHHFASVPLRPSGADRSLVNAAHGLDEKNDSSKMSPRPFQRHLNFFKNFRVSSRKTWKDCPSPLSSQQNSIEEFCFRDCRFWKGRPCKSTTRDAAVRTCRTRTRPRGPFYRSVYLISPLFFSPLF